MAALMILADISWALRPKAITQGAMSMTSMAVLLVQCAYDMNRFCRCFMDISINGNHTGRLVYGLYGNTTPRTAENFAKLCTGEVRKLFVAQKVPVCSVCMATRLQVSGELCEALHGRDEDEDFCFVMLRVLCV